MTVYDDKCHQPEHKPGACNFRRDYWVRGGVTCQFQLWCSWPAPQRRNFGKVVSSGPCPGWIFFKKTPASSRNIRYFVSRNGWQDVFTEDHLLFNGAARITRCPVRRNTIRGQGKLILLAPWRSRTVFFHRARNKNPITRLYECQALRHIRH